MRIPYDTMWDVLQQVLLQYGFSTEKAKLIARAHTQASCDGVHSHGLNRFPLFVRYLQDGYIIPGAEPTCLAALGSIEQWDGNRGAGVWNAYHAQERAMALAKQHHIGAVAMRNTNHWLRGGAYAGQAAGQGMITLCLTNTKPNVTPWGGLASVLGNNPFVMGIPRRDEPVVLDMALSQYSFGKINSYKQQNKQLPYPGGWDPQGNLTTDPEQILIKELGLPIGYWKGSGLTMMVDMLVSLLSGGDPVHKIGERPAEIGVSQLFLCIDPGKLGDLQDQEKLLDDIIASVHQVPKVEGKNTYYPGENSLKTRQKSLQKGIWVHQETWEKVQGMVGE